MQDTPEAMIARLDASLARRGEDVVLRRNTMGPGGLQIPYDATVRGHVRGYDAQELTSTIIQGDTKIIISPTGIEAAGWPGPSVGTVVGDRRVPRKNDVVVVQGAPRQVMSAAPKYVAGTLVRIEIQVRGQAG